MTHPARVPSAFARGILDENERAAALTALPDGPDPMKPEVSGERLVSVRVLRDSIAVILVVLGLLVGDVVAWVAGGWVYGGAVLAVDCVLLGLILGASSNG